MIRGLFSLFCAVLLVCLLQPASAEGYLFISSEPFDSKVLIDGAEQPETTPLLRRLAEGEYEIEIYQEGHRPAETSVRVEEGEHLVLEPTLPPTYVTLSFPEDKGAPTALPDGPYRLLQGEQGTIIEPLYPRESRLRLFRILSPALLGAASAATIATFALPPEQPRLGYIPVATFQLSSLLFGALTLREERRREEYVASWSAPENPYYPSRAGTQAERARRALERGDLLKARREFQTLIAEYPRAPSVPEAIFTLARLDFLEGETGAGADQLQRLRSEYPVVEYYDRATIELARIALEEGRTAEARRLLSELTGSDPSIEYGELGSLIE
ncbi:MAG: PEGA domain-containing protein [Alkalispirochaetaceae bacterium]